MVIIESTSKLFIDQTLYQIFDSQLRNLQFLFHFKSEIESFKVVPILLCYCWKFAALLQLNKNKLFSKYVMIITTDYTNADQYDCVDFVLWFRSRDVLPFLSSYLQKTSWAHKTYYKCVLRFHDISQMLFIYSHHLEGHFIFPLK